MMEVGVKVAHGAFLVLLKDEGNSIARLPPQLIKDGRLLLNYH
jgi:hypothetical protein